MKMKEMIVRYADNGYGNAAGEIVGELVRCAECIYKGETDGYGPYCNYWHHIIGDGFCSYGERRADEHTD